MSWMEKKIREHSASKFWDKGCFDVDELSLEQESDHLIALMAL